MVESPALELAYTMHDSPTPEVRRRTERGGPLPGVRRRHRARFSRIRRAALARPRRLCGCALTVPTRRVGVGLANQAEALAAGSFAERIAGERYGHGREGLQLELDRLPAELEEEGTRKNAYLEQERGICSRGQLRGCRARPCCSRTAEGCFGVGPLAQGGQAGLTDLRRAGQGGGAGGQPGEAVERACDGCGRLLHTR